MNLFTVISKFFPTQREFQEGHKKAKIVLHITNARRPTPYLLVINSIEYHPNDNEVSVSSILQDGRVVEERTYHWNGKDHHFMMRSIVNNIRVRSLAKRRGAKQTINIYAHDPSGQR